PMHSRPGEPDDDTGENEKDQRVRQLDAGDNALLPGARDDHRTKSLPRRRVDHRADRRIRARSAVERTNDDVESTTAHAISTLLSDGFTHACTLPRLLRCCCPARGLSEQVTYTRKDGFCEVCSRGGAGCE